MWMLSEREINLQRDINRLTAEDEQCQEEIREKERRRAEIERQKQEVSNVILSILLLVGPRNCQSHQRKR